MSRPNPRSKAPGPRATVRHRAEYGAVRVLQGLVRMLPERGALAMGAVAARSVGGLRVRARQVEENLERAFPEADPSVRRALARETWGHMGTEIAMLLRLGRLDRHALRAWVLERTTWLDEATAQVHMRMLEDAKRGLGSVLVTGHFGNWELAGAAVVARGLELDAVAVRQRNPLVDRALREQREAFGMRVIDRDASPRAVPEALRAGRAVALVADQHTRGGVRIPFFGHPALTPRGPAVFARRTGTGVVFGGAVALEGRPHRYGVFLERIDVEVTADKEADVLRVTEALGAALERRIRAFPGQYLWQHRRWRLPAGP